MRFCSIKMSLPLVMILAMKLRKIVQLLNGLCVSVEKQLLKRFAYKASDIIVM